MSEWISVKKRLRNYKALLKEKKTLEKQIETVEATLLHPKIQRIKHTPSASGGGNAMEDMAAKHLELLDLLHAKNDHLLAEMLSIELAIERLDPDDRNLIRLYYINGLTWEEVCVSIGYSWSQTHRIHARALQRLADAADARCSR